MCVCVYTKKFSLWEFLTLIRSKRTLRSTFIRFVREVLGEVNMKVSGNIATRSRNCRRVGNLSIKLIEKAYIGLNRISIVEKKQSIILVLRSILIIQ